MNQPLASPILIRTNATNAMARLPAGPAAAISAARLGYFAAQYGSYGVLAQPIAQPCVSAVSSGTTSMPIGSRLMCGMGRERHLSAVIRRRIPAPQRDQRVHRFVNGRGEEKCHEPEEARSPAFLDQSSIRSPL